MDEMIAEPVALKSVTIEAQEDGSFMVGTEPEMPEESMEQDQASGMQSAMSIDEALDLARQMLQDDGRSPESAMMDGYNKGAPKPAMTPKKVFGE